jgi:hypothetical protein
LSKQVKGFENVWSGLEAIKEGMEGELKNGMDYREMPFIPGGKLSFVWNAGAGATLKLFGYKTTTAVVYFIYIKCNLMHIGNMFF